MPRYDLTIGYETDLTKAEDAAITAHRQWTRASDDRELLAQLLAEEEIASILHRLREIPALQRQDALESMDRPDQLPLYTALLRLLEVETQAAHARIRHLEERAAAEGSEPVEIDC